jgi:hypothetical protein
MVQVEKDLSLRRDDSSAVFAVISSECEKSFPVRQFKTLELNHYPMAERLEEIAGVE